jgi:mycofactocin system transcriptional regulator
VRDPVKPAGTARGRPRTTTHDAVAKVALDLFRRNGFEETTMDDIAAACGVARRTLFRYFPSKNDIVWGDFATVRRRLTAELAAADPDEPLSETLVRAIVESNRYPAEELPTLRARMALITSVPALQGHSMIRYEEWRDDVAAFVATRLGARPHDLLPQLVGQIALAAAMSAFVHWVRNEDAVLEDVLEQALRVATAGVDRLVR